MLDVYREVLPNGYLLILSPEASSTDEVKLSRALHRATRSEKQAILIDFSLVDNLSEEAIELLLAYAYMLHAQDRRLILCHVPQPVQHHFIYLDAASQPLLVPSLLDAIHEIEVDLGHNLIPHPDRIRQAG
jgi:anti-anti-sigma regulatory factor